ncbi:uncharacterized protein JCM6883_007454 [Sporobolomyces salmoneus]|uniref:uncharacterized protein n=1 Tax=Sporobolomyces salmoneus TaxID=183962 RepID=UPI00316F7D72
MRSLTSLPPELVREIVESTVPQYHHSSTYRERRSTLRTLSLVCRQFRTIAQPLLLGIVAFGPWDDIDRIPEASAERGADIRCAVVFISTQEDKAATVAKIFKRISSAETLILQNECQPVVDLSALGALSSEYSPTLRQNRKLTSKTPTDLSSLRLVGDGLTLNTPTPLINLRSVALCFPGPELVDSLLKPTILPNLRHLALANPTNARYNLSGVVQLLPQLETINIDMGSWRGIRETKPAIAAIQRTLVSCGSYNLARLNLDDKLPIAHLAVADKIVYQSKVKQKEIVSNLEIFANHLAEIPSHSIESIHVTASLNDFPEATTKLSEACRDRGIEFVVESPGQDRSNVDFCVSSNFVKMRRRKELEGERGRKHERDR